MRQCVISHNQCRSHRAKALAEALHRGTTSNVVAGHPAGLSAWMSEQVSGRVVLATGKESSLPNVSRLDAFSGWLCAICKPGGLLPLVAHDPEPQVISSLPDLPPKAQNVALQRLHSQVVHLCVRRDLDILIGLRTLCLFWKHKRGDSITV